MEKKTKKIIKNNKAFSLLELLITLAIFGILIVTVTNIIMINLKVSRRVRARSYVREETSFMLKVLKKDIRNAENITPGGDEGSLTVSVLDSDGEGHIYTWYQETGRIRRSEDENITYMTPQDLEFDPDEPLGFSSSCDDTNCVIRISVKARTVGMPEDQWITKKVAVSTRNYVFYYY